MNGDGGNLLIGIDGEGVVLGLFPDYSTLKDGNKDKFELHLTQVLIKDFTLPTFKAYCRITFLPYAEHEVCVVTVNPSIQPHISFLLIVTRCQLAW